MYLPAKGHPSIPKILRDDILPLIEMTSFKKMSSLLRTPDPDFKPIDLPAVPEQMDDGMFKQLFYIVFLAPPDFYFFVVFKFLEFYIRIILKEFFVEFEHFSKFNPVFFNCFEYRR
jgi:hypothetical protein